MQRYHGQCGTLIFSRDSVVLRVKMHDGVISVHPRYAMTLAEFSARSVKVASLRLPYAEADTYLRRCIACFDIDEPDIGTTLEGLLDIVKARMCLQWSLSTNPWRRDAPVAQTSLQHFMGTGIVHMFCLSNQYIYIYRYRRWHTPVHARGRKDGRSHRQHGSETCLRRRTGCAKGVYRQF